MKTLSSTLAIVFLSVLFSLYAGEVYLQYFVDRTPVETKSRPDRDGRHAVEVVDDLRKQGKPAFPVLNFRADVMNRDKDDAFHSLFSENGRELLPLGNVANALTVFCNENGVWETYVSDRFGFNNPDAVWEGKPASVLALGDSFTHGVCPPPGQHMVDLIRNAYPPTVNLGRMGTGPFYQLATFKEYGPALRPRIVLWFFMEDNDIVGDMHDEVLSPLLRRYAEEPGFSQSLISRQAAIAPLMRAQADAMQEKYLRLVQERNSKAVESIAAAKPDNWGAVKDKLESLSQLTFVRGVLGIGGAGGNKKARLERLYGDYEMALKEAKRLADGWGGRIYIVHLPDHHRFLNIRQRLVKDAQREKVEELVRANGLGWIDVTPAFARHPDVDSLFWSHYTPEGYKLVADVVLERLKQDGF